MRLGAPAFTFKSYLGRARDTGRDKHKRLSHPPTPISWTGSLRDPSHACKPHDARDAGWQAHRSPPDTAFTPLPRPAVKPAAPSHVKPCSMYRRPTANAGYKVSHVHTLIR